MTYNKRKTRRINSYNKTKTRRINYYKKRTQKIKKYKRRTRKIKTYKKIKKYKGGGNSLNIKKYPYNVELAIAPPDNSVQTNLLNSLSNLSKIVFIRHLQSTGFSQTWKKGPNSTGNKLLAFKRSVPPILAKNLTGLLAHAITFITDSGHMFDEDANGYLADIEQEKFVVKLLPGKKSLEPGIEERTINEGTKLIIKGITINDDDDTFVIATSPLLRCLLTTIEVIESLHKYIPNLKFMVIIGPFKEAVKRKIPGDYGNEYSYGTLKQFMDDAINKGFKILSKDKNNNGNLSIYYVDLINDELVPIDETTKDSDINDIFKENYMSYKSNSTNGIDLAKGVHKTALALNKVHNMTNKSLYVITHSKAIQLLYNRLGGRSEFYPSNGEGLSIE